MEHPVNLTAKFHGPDAATVRKLVRDYAAGSPLLPDPGPGRIETSYRLDRELVRQKTLLAGEWRVAVFLRRLLWTYFQGRRKDMPALAPASESSAPGRLAFTQPRLEPVALPKGSGRIELDAEQAKAALIRAGACQSPQPSSRYFLFGRMLTREESGRVLQSWEL